MTAAQTNTRLQVTMDPQAEPPGPVMNDQSTRCHLQQRQPHRRARGVAPQDDRCCKCALSLISPCTPVPESYGGVILTSTLTSGSCGSPYRADFLKKVLKKHKYEFLASKRCDESLTSYGLGGSCFRDLRHMRVCLHIPCIYAQCILVQGSLSAAAREDGSGFPQRRRLTGACLQSGGAHSWVRCIHWPHNNYSSEMQGCSSCELDLGVIR
jgi:hypothetical protein